VYLFILTNTVSSFGKVEAKDHQRFQASFATTLKVHMTDLKKRERKDRKKAAEGDKKEGGLKKSRKA
jgi:signal recognition particle subunit SRP14